MKKTRLKKNKDVVLIMIGLGLVALIILFAVLINDFGSDTKAIYGERLDGIEKVKISKDDTEKISESIEKTGKVESVKTYAQGKIIISEVIVKKEVSRDDAKSLAPLLVENISDDSKKFYDFQIFIDKDDDATFPIIGYRQHSKDDFIWTLDR